MHSFFPILLASSGLALAADRPNILWISSEDNSPHLGCYGDPDANTPNLDALAKRSLRYEKCWSVAPVCAPSRTALITGAYPSSLGAEQMRSLVALPPDVKLLPQHLRAAGYYCTNNEKEDYNVKPNGQPWDESSKRAHYKNRPAGAPFFAVFNFTQTHESQTRKRPHTFVHDPAKITVPPQHPDLPEVRKAWAQVHDQMTVMDLAAGEKLTELAAAGLAEDTVVFYFGDHGTGLARSKRYPGESGLRVPLIVHFPEKWKHLAPPEYMAGASTKRLVNFTDFAPTLLSIVGVEIPKSMQGKAFAGKVAAPARAHNHGLRARMDERYDLARSVTDGRYVYIKNYYPDLPWGQQNSYMFLTPLTQEWYAAYLEKKLAPQHARFWEPKGAEELYDLQTDPAELKNLATDASHTETLKKLRQAQVDHAMAVRDLSLVPEAELLAMAGEGPPAAVAVDVPAVLEMANLATNGETATPEALGKGLASQDASLRYWAATGLRLRGSAAVAAHAGELEKLQKDASPSVRLVAAAALAAHGAPVQQQAALEVLLSHAQIEQNPYHISVAALNYWDNLPPNLTAPHLSKISQLSASGAKVNSRMSDYLKRLKTKLTGGQPAAE